MEQDKVTRLMNHRDCDKTGWSFVRLVSNILGKRDYLTGKTSNRTMFLLDHKVLGQQHFNQENGIDILLISQCAREMEPEATTNIHEEQYENLFRAPWTNETSKKTGLPYEMQIVYLCGSQYISKVMIGSKGWKVTKDGADLTKFVSGRDSIDAAKLDCHECILNDLKDNE